MMRYLFLQKLSEVFWCHGKQSKLEIESWSFWFWIYYQVIPCTAQSKSPSLPGPQISLKTEFLRLLIIKFLVPLNIFNIPPRNFYYKTYSPHPYPHTYFHILELDYFTIKIRNKFSISPPSPSSYCLKYCH